MKRFINNLKITYWTFKYHLNSKINRLLVSIPFKIISKKQYLKFINAVYATDYREETTKQPPKSFRRHPITSEELERNI